MSSYGSIYDPVQLPWLGRNPILDIGRHAVAIHERRCFYQDNLWGDPYPGQDIRQVWFCGVHSDIGGSYPEAESGLSKITLEWMTAEATRAGLRIQQEKANKILGRPSSIHVPGLADYVLPDNDACLHKSLTGSWWAVEILPHQDPHPGDGWHIPLGRPRTIPDGSWIHESVLTSRWKPEHLPPHNVEPWRDKPESRSSTGADRVYGPDCEGGPAKPKLTGPLGKGLALAAAGAVAFTVLRRSANAAKSRA